MTRWWSTGRAWRAAGCAALLAAHCRRRVRRLARRDDDPPSPNGSRDDPQLRPRGRPTSLSGTAPSRATSKKAWAAPAMTRWHPGSSRMSMADLAGGSPLRKGIFTQKRKAAKTQRGEERSGERNLHPLHFSLFIDGRARIAGGDFERFVIPRAWRLCLCVKISPLDDPFHVPLTESPSLTDSRDAFSLLPSNDFHVDRTLRIAYRSAAVSTRLWRFRL